MQSEEQAKHLVSRCGKQRVPVLLQISVTAQAEVLIAHRCSPPVQALTGSSVAGALQAGDGEDCSCCEVLKQLSWPCFSSTLPAVLQLYHAGNAESLS